MAEGYTIKHVDEFEEMEGPGAPPGGLPARPWEPRPSASTSSTSSPAVEIPAHDHSGDDQEEVFVILDGEGTIVAGDEEHEPRPAPSAASPPTSTARSATNRTPPSAPY